MAEKSVFKSSMRNALEKARRVAEDYYTIREWEPPLYNKLGAGLFARYWINGGSYWSTFPCFKSCYAGTLKGTLKEMAEDSKFGETLHLAVELPLLTLFAYAAIEGNSWTATAIVGLVNVGNGMSTIAQRMIRDRALKTLKRYEEIYD